MYVWLTLFLPLAILIGLIAAYARMSKQKFVRRSYGLTVIFRMKRLLILLQEHRGLSYRAAKGEQELGPTLSRQEQQIGTYINALNPMILRPTEKQHWQDIVAHWQRLQLRYVSLDARNIFDQHSRLIASLLALMEDVFDYSFLGELLAQGNKLDWYKLLGIAEWVGQVRAIGSASFFCKSLHAIDEGRLLALRNQLRNNLPYLQYAEIETGALEKVLQLLEQDILVKKFDQTGSDDFFSLATEAITPIGAAFENKMEYLASRLGKPGFNRVGPRE